MSVNLFLFVYVDRWETGTSNEGTAEKKARAGSFSCEYRHIYFFFKKHLRIALSVVLSVTSAFLLTETYRDAELGGGPRNGGVAWKKGGGQKSGDAQEVPFTQT